MTFLHTARYIVLALFVLVTLLLIYAGRDRA